MVCMHSVEICYHFKNHLKYRNFLNLIPLFFLSLQNPEVFATFGRKSVKNILCNITVIYNQSEVTILPLPELVNAPGF